MKSSSNSAIQVSLVRCTSYEEAALLSSLQKALDLLGGIQQFVRRGQRVFVKVNHLPPPSVAERGIVTHPAFVEQVLAILLETGAQVRVGDDINPAQGDGFAVSGLRQVCQKLGVKLVNLREQGFQLVSIPGAEVLPTTYLARAVLEADVIVNLPKFKTHSLTVFTGAIKNIYGCLPQGLRVRYHREFQGQKFHSVLVDLFSAVRPQLHIMDAIVGMEGDGPGNGDLRNIGLVLAGPDGVALDRVALAVAGIGPDQVYYLKEAASRRLGSLDNVRVLGEHIDEVRIPDFKSGAVSYQIVRRWVPDFVFRAIVRQFESHPEVIVENCEGCRACEKACPVKAIRVWQGVAKINRQRCIACMCCHEACRFQAIRSRKSMIGKLIIAGVQYLRSLRRYGVS